MNYNQTQVETSAQNFQLPDRAIRSQRWWEGRVKDYMKAHRCSKRQAESELFDRLEVQ